MTGHIFQIFVIDLSAVRPGDDTHINAVFHAFAICSPSFLSTITMVSPVWLLTLPAFIYMVFALRRRSRHRLPPGPPGLPIIGSALALPTVNGYKVLSKLGKQYGMLRCISSYTVVPATKRRAHRASILDQNSQYSVHHHEHTFCNSGYTSQAFSNNFAPSY